MSAGCKHFDRGRCKIGVTGSLCGGGVIIKIDCSACEKYDGPIRGAGDIIEIAARKTGGKKLAKGFEKLVGKPCGCHNRRVALNQIGKCK